MRERMVGGAVVVVLVLALVGVLVLRGSDDKSSASEGPGTGTARTAHPVQPAKPGTYHYQVTRTDQGQAPQTYTSTLVLAAQSEVRDQLGTKVQRDFRRHDDERIETAMTLRNGTYTGRCDWKPDLVVLHVSLRVGDRWSAGGACELPVEGGTVHVVVEEQVSVEAVETVTDTGSPVSVVRIKRHTTTTSTTGQVRSTRVVDRTEWLAPATGLVVRAVDRVTETGAGAPKSYEVTERLRSLTPE